MRRKFVSPPIWIGSRSGRTANAAIAKAAGTRWKVAAVAPRAVPPRIRARTSAPGWEVNCSNRSSPHTSPASSADGGRQADAHGGVAVSRLDQDQGRAGAAARDERAQELETRRRSSRRPPASRDRPRRARRHRSPRRRVALADVEALREDHHAVLLGNGHAQAVAARAPPAHLRRRGRPRRT